MKLIDIDFEKSSGVVAEAPKLIRILFQFETKEHKRIFKSMYFRTIEFNHIGVIRVVNTFICSILELLD